MGRSEIFSFFFYFKKKKKVDRRFQDFLVGRKGQHNNFFVKA